MPTNSAGNLLIKSIVDEGKRRLGLDKELELGPTPKIIVIGDVMLDRHVTCEVNGISPEDDLAWKLKEISTSVAPGGGANVAANLSALRTDVHLIAVMGDDIEGDILKRSIHEHEIEATFIREKLRQTTTKTRYITKHGRHVARIDREERMSLSKAILEQVHIRLRSLNSVGFDAIVVSDYEKGVVSKDLMEIVTAFKKPVIVDPKSNFFSYGPVYAVTPNQKEFVESERNQHKAMKSSQFVVKKMSEHGCQLLRPQAEIGCSYLDAVRTFKTNARKLGDPTGCGDSFLAAFSMAVAMNWTISEACMLGNAAGAVAYDFTGAHAVTREELLKELRSFNYEE